MLVVDGVFSPGHPGLGLVLQSQDQALLLPARLLFFLLLGLFGLGF